MARFLLAMAITCVATSAHAANLRVWAGGFRNDVFEFYDAQELCCAISFGQLDGSPYDGNLTGLVYSVAAPDRFDNPAFPVPGGELVRTTSLPLPQAAHDALTQPGWIKVRTGWPAVDGTFQSDTFVSFPWDTVAPGAADPWSLQLGDDGPGSQVDEPAQFALPADWQALRVDFVTTIDDTRGGRAIQADVWIVGTASVPAPSSALLALVGLCGVLSRQFHRRRGHRRNQGSCRG